MNSASATTPLARGWTAVLAALSPRRARLDSGPRDLGSPGRPVTGRPDTGRSTTGHRDRETIGAGTGRRPGGVDVAPFPPLRRRSGPRFDETTALPIDTPERLDAILRGAGARLRQLPDVEDLGHRTVAWRARLQQVMRETAQARSRLASGTYGTCLSCTGPISLARLTDRPWARQCIYCELDI